MLTLADKGPQQVKIDGLCQALGVTKGSFYHHFSHHADFVTALLEHWEATHTHQLIEAVAGIKTASERAERLSELVYGKDMGAEVAMRAWGQSHPEVADRVKAVDARRLDYLAQLAVQMGASAAQAQSAGSDGLCPAGRHSTLAATHHGERGRKDGPGIARHGLQPAERTHRERAEHVGLGRRPGLLLPPLCTWRSSQAARPGTAFSAPVKPWPGWHPEDTPGQPP